MARELPQACLGCEEDLSALIDEELSPARETEVRAHLEGCDRCALRLQELCNVDLELAGLAQPAASAELARGLMARIAADAGAEDSAAAARVTRTAAPPARRRWRAGAAVSRIAVAAGVLLAAWLLLRGDDGVLPETPVAVTRPGATGAPPAQGQPEALPLAAAPGETLAELPVEDLAMLLELQELEDLDLIANLELLEILVELERGAG